MECPCLDTNGSLWGLLLLIARAAERERRASRRHPLSPAGLSARSHHATSQGPQGAVRERPHPVAFCFSWRSERPLETFSSVASLLDSCNTFSTTLKNTRAQQTVQYSTNANDPPQALHSKTYALATEHARRLVLAALSLTLLVARLAPLSRSAACSKQPTVLR